MADEAHSLFSASGADGWSSCYGKPAMEEGRKTSSEYADEGTAAHELANRVLTARIQGRAITASEHHVGVKIDVERYDAKAKKKVKRTFTVDTDMAEHVDDFVDHFMAVTQGRGETIRLAEQRVRYHAYLGVPPQLAWGTGDGIAVLFDMPELEWEDPLTGNVRVFPPGDELVVDDLKFGRGVRVSVRGKQLFLYGAGAYFEWSHVANFTRIRLIIHQPRLDHVDEIVLTPDELLADVMGLKTAVPKVLEAFELARELREAGRSDLEVSQELDAKGFLHPSEKACRFCDGKAACAALLAVASEGFNGRAVTPDDFEDLTVDTPADVRDYGSNYLANAHSVLPLVELWVIAVKGELMRRHLADDPVPGVKVVQGRPGNRAYTDKGAVEALVRGLPPAIRDLMYDRKLKTPAQAEKALKTAPSAWTRLASMIHRPPGKYTLVPASDPRPAVTKKAQADDFEDLTEDEPEAQGVAAGGNRHPFRR